MPSTGFQLFSSVNQTNVSGPRNWLNLENALNLTSFAETANGSDPLSETARFFGPVISPPQASTIDSISINMRGYQNVPLLANTTMYVRIGSGTWRTDNISSNLNDNILSGSLSYWGISQQTARDFANGLVSLQIYFVETQGAVESWRMYYAQADFEYSGALVFPPVTF